MALALHASAQAAAGIAASQSNRARVSSSAEAPDSLRTDDTWRVRRDLSSLDSSSSSRLALRSVANPSASSPAPRALPFKRTSGFPAVCTRAAGGAGLADEQDQDRGMGEGSAGLGSVQVPAGTMMVPVMKKGYGAFGGGATLEKAKLDVSLPQTKTSPQIELGGGGGNAGKGVSFGGGDGGDDGGDDDDYFGEEGDGDDDGDDGFLRRLIIGEVFDKEAVEAVLQEWFRTMKDLPAGLFRAVEMGLVSSAQLARFMSIDARPTMARVVARLAPSELSRAFIGRMMADPAFIFKVALEQAVTIGAAVHWEVKQRGERLKQEWDIALSNVLAVAACNAAMIWCLSPSRSYGTTASSDWQNALQKLPNHMFDKSYPLREFNLTSRAGSFFYKAAELSLVGSLVGGATGALSNALLSLRKKGTGEAQVSVPVPTASTAAAAYGAHMGLSGNLRYQLLYGLDRLLQQHFQHIPVAILGTTALRCGNVLLGEPSRLAWLGLDDESMQMKQAESLAYRRPSASGPQQKQSLREQLSAWFADVKRNSKNAKARRPRAARQRSAGADGEGAAEEEVVAVRRPKRKIKQRTAVAQ